MSTFSLFVMFGLLLQWSALLQTEEYKRPTPQVVKDLRGSDSVKQLEAAKILSTRKEAGVDDLIDMLKNGDPDLRAWAAYTLARIGPDARQATPALTEMLKDKNPDLRAWAAYALGKIGPDAGKAVPDLLSTCADPEPAVRGEALLAVSKIDPKLEIVGKLDAATKKRVMHNLDANPDLTALLFDTNGGKRLGNDAFQQFDASRAFGTPKANWGGSHGLLVGGNGKYSFKALPSLHGVFNKPDPVPPPRRLAIGPPDPLQDQKTLAKIDAEERMRELDKVLKKTSELSDRELCGQLTAKDAQDRWAAVLVAGDRGLHCETELMNRLVDKDDAVRQAARLALAVFSGGVDFGPMPDARKDECEGSAARWHAWLARRSDDPPAGDHPLSDLEKERKHRKSQVAKKEAAPDSPDAGEKRAELEAARLVDEMRRANADQRSATLEKLRDGKGPAYTAGLAEVIARLDGDSKKEARQAMADRLARMTAATLRAKLADEDLEIRRAAALACAMKDEIAFVPDVIPLLADREPLVARAAYAALKSLSGKDFGPSRDANDEEKARAIADWKAWWTKR
jgi:HEAT repeat protein